MKFCNYKKIMLALGCMVFVLGLLYALPKPTSAGGIFSCVWDITNQRCVIVPHCTDSWLPIFPFGTDCSDLTLTTCTTPSSGYACIDPNAIPPPPPSPTGATLPTLGTFRCDMFAGNICHELANCGPCEDPVTIFGGCINFSQNFTKCTDGTEYRCTYRCASNQACLIQTNGTYNCIQPPSTPTGSGCALLGGDQFCQSVNGSPDFHCNATTGVCERTTTGGPGPGPNIKEGGACTASIDCLWPLLCYSGKCQDPNKTCIPGGNTCKACTRSEECPANEVCSRNFCQQVECKGDYTKCPLGSVCRLTDTNCQHAPAAGTQTGLVQCGGLILDNAGNIIGQEYSCRFIDFFKMLHDAIFFVTSVLAPVLVALMVAIGGFRILISRGNPGEYAAGKKMITWALIGFVVVLLAWTIVNTILSVIGVAAWTGLAGGGWAIITF